MGIQVIGINHKTADVKARESALGILKRYPGVLLSTCNRVELYQMANDKWLMTNEGVFYHLMNEDAVRHLFRVASGLDSQILGEGEILGQVRRTHLLSKGRYPMVDRLFERAVEVGGRVREETGVSRGNVSVASIAIGKAERLLCGCNEKKILLIGVGKLTETIAKTLLKMNSAFILVANRTHEKAQALAKIVGGRAVHFDELERELLDADLVVSSTSAPHYVLRPKHVQGRSKPLLVIDLAVPRDVDPQVAMIGGVTLLNIDHVREEINLNLSKRKIEAVFAEGIIGEEVRRFCERYELEPAAVA